MKITLKNSLRKIGESPVIEETIEDDDSYFFPFERHYIFIAIL